MFLTIKEHCLLKTCIWDLVHSRLPINVTYQSNYEHKTQNMPSAERTPPSGRTWVPTQCLTSKSFPIRICLIEPIFSVWFRLLLSSFSLPGAMLRRVKTKRWFRHEHIVWYCGSRKANKMLGCIHRHLKYREDKTATFLFCITQIPSIQI